MRSRVATVAWVGWAAWAMAAGAGCHLVAGLNDPTPGTGGSGASAGSGTVSTSGGGTTGGGGTGSLCEPGTKKACAYSGDAKTENVGECHAGTQKCDADGTSYEPCEGEVLPAAEVCHNGEDEDCDGVACAAPLWSKLWGDAGDQTLSGVSADVLGNITLWGKFVGSLDFTESFISTAMPAGFVAKVDPGLTGLWSVKSGWPNVDSGTCRLDGECLVTSSIASIKVDNVQPDGMAGWNATYGGNMNAIAQAATANTDSFFVVGYFSTQTTFGGTILTPVGGQDIFLLRISVADGSLLSARRYGSNTSQVGQKVVADTEGNTVISGRYSGSLLSSNGEMANDDLFVFRVNAFGFSSWNHGFPGDWFLYDHVADKGGSSVLAGRFTGPAQIVNKMINGTGPADLFAVKLSAAGDLAWATSFGGPNFQPAADAASSGASVITDSKANVLISTRGKGTLSFGGDELGKPGEVSEFLVKLDKDGNHLWSKAFGPLGETGGCVVTIGIMDEPTLACSIEAASIDFGSGPLEGKGGLDVVVAKFAP